MNRVLSFAIEELKIKDCIAVHIVENPDSGNVIKNWSFSIKKRFHMSAMAEQFAA